MSTGDPVTPEPGQYPPPRQQYPPPGQQQSYPPPGQQYPAGPTQPYPAGPTQPYPAAAGIGVTPDERNWAMAAHLSAIVGAWLFLGFIGPLVVLLIQGDKSPYVRNHTVEALNFNLSVLIYAIAGGILALIFIGFLVLAAVGILWLVCTVLATIKASNGEPYRYPLTIRMVH